MPYIHLSDGIFPLWALVLWNGLAIALLGAMVYRVRKRGLETRRIALAGIAGAASFAIFQLNLPILGGVHMNLTGLIGILAGPAIGTLIVLVVNILSAVIGHGAWGLIGANTLVNAAEVIVTYYAFVALVRANWDTFPTAATATIAGLASGALVMGAIPLVSGIRGTAIQGLDLALYMSALVALNLGVAVAEGLLTGLTVSSLTSIHPDLIRGSADVAAEVDKSNKSRKTVYALVNEIVGSARAVRLVWVDPPFQPVKAVSESPPAEVSNSKTDRRLSTNKFLHKSEPSKSN